MIEGFRHVRAVADTAGCRQERGARAAQYVRMSTDLQKYSTQTQADAIAALAARRNLVIVRKYADDGRSGLNISGRAALQNLIRDVKSGRKEFEFILVYDVSRWGRFPDADESAYYEYICKEAGVQVLYCAEQFENDGSLASTVLKNIKRAMAGEYSRELSTKVFVGQSRGVRQGFFQGGTARLRTAPPHARRRRRSKSRAQTWAAEEPSNRSHYSLAGTAIRSERLLGACLLLLRSIRKAGRRSLQS